MVPTPTGQADRAGLDQGSALQVHRTVHDHHPLGGEHFLRWLGVWTDTVDQMYQGLRAEQAKIQATRIARAMHRRLNGTGDQDLDRLLLPPVRRPASRS